MLLSNINEHILHQIFVRSYLVIQSVYELRDDFYEPLTRNIVVITSKLINQFDGMVAHWNKVEYLEAIFKEKLVLPLVESDRFYKTSQSTEHILLSFVCKAFIL